MWYNHRSSSPMSTLYKRLRVDTANLLIQSGRNRLPESKSLNTNLNFRRYTLWPLNSRQTRLWTKLTSRDIEVEMVVALEEGHMSSQMWLVTSVSRRAISRKNARQRELALVGTHPSITQMRFQNGLLRSLLFWIPKILQHTPQPATTTSTRCAPLEIMIMAYGYFTRNMDMTSGKKSRQEIICLFSNPNNNEIIYCSRLINTSEESTEEEETGWDDSQGTDLISLSRFELLEWFIKRFYSYLLLIFTILWFWCDTES